jgi:hypothetical protein
MKKLISKFCALLVCAICDAGGESADLWVEPQQPALLNLNSMLDDRDYADPVSYSASGLPAPQFRGAVQLIYCGSHMLHDFYLCVNGQDFRSPEKILAAIGASGDSGFLAVQSFNWLKDRIFHASSFTDENTHLCNICTVYGSDFCNDDTRALMEFLRYFGVKGRIAPLNGHAIGEYFVDVTGVWWTETKTSFSWNGIISNRPPTTISATTLSSPFAANRTENSCQMAEKLGIPSRKE